MPSPVASLNPHPDLFARALHIFCKCAIFTWLLSFIALASLPTLNQPAGDEEASYQPGRAAPNYSWNIERMRLLRDVALSNETRDETDGRLRDLSAEDAAVFQRYYRLFEFAMERSQGEVAILPSSDWASEPAVLVVLRPPLRDPREAMFISCPMDVWGLEELGGNKLVDREGSIKWAVRLADLFSEIGNSKWLSKDVFIIITPTTDRSGRPLDHSTGTRQFLQWYLDDAEGSAPLSATRVARSGIARAALVIPQPLQTGESFEVHVQYEPLDNVTPNIDFVGKSLRSFVVNGATVHYRGMWDAMLHQLSGHTRNEHHTAYLERQIAAMGLQMRGPWKKRHLNKSHWTSYARIIEDVVREANSLVMQFHHLSTLYFLTGVDNGDALSKNIVRSNEFMMPILFMSIALFCLDVPALTSIKLRQISGWMNLPRREPFASVIIQSCTGIGIVCMSLLTALMTSNLIISREASCDRETVQALCTATLDMNDTRMLGINESVLVFSSLASAATLFLSCLIGSLAFDEIPRREAFAGLVRAAAMGVRLIIPVIIFPLTVISPATGIVVAPLLTAMGFVCYICSEANPIYGAIFLVTGPIVSTIVKSQWAFQYAQALLKEMLPFLWRALQPLVMSDLAGRMVDDPAGLVEAITTESLKSHICLGSYTYPMLLMALVSFTLITASTLFTLGIRVRGRRPRSTPRIKAD